MFSKMPNYMEIYGDCDIYELSELYERAVSRTEREWICRRMTELKDGGNPDDAEQGDTNLPESKR